MFLNVFFMVLEWSFSGIFFYLLLRCFQYFAVALYSGIQHVGNSTVLAVIICVCL